MVTSLGGLALAATGLEGVVLEPRRLRVSRHHIGEPSRSAGPTVRIAQLTDLHLRSLSPYEEDVARTVTDLRPDLIVFTGDSVDRPQYVSPFAEFLQLLDAETTKYAVLGNWEHAGGVDLRQLDAVYQAANCRLLINESAVHEFGGARLLVSGLDDFVAGRPDLAAALASAPAVPNRLLLAHCPGQRDRLLGDGDQGTDATERREGTPSRPQYVLSGHTHGGQVAFFGFAPLRPRGSGRYHSGWYRGGRPELYVSCGIGWSGLPIRLGAPPEIACFEWTLVPDRSAQRVVGAPTSD